MFNMNYSQGYYGGSGMKYIGSPVDNQYSLSYLNQPQTNSALSTGFYNPNSSIWASSMQTKQDTTNKLLMMIFNILTEKDNEAEVAPKTEATKERTTAKILRFLTVKKSKR